MTRALDAAKYLLYLGGSESPMSSLMVQRLLYLAQGVALVLRDEPLFIDRLEAWEHGPACPVVHREYQRYGRFPIRAPAGYDPATLPTTDREILDAVFATYGRLSAWQLWEVMRDDPPYKDHYRPGVQGIEIPHKALKDHFPSRVRRS